MLYLINKKSGKVIEKSETKGALRRLKKNQKNPERYMISKFESLDESKKAIKKNKETFTKNAKDAKKARKEKKVKKEKTEKSEKKEKKSKKKKKNLINEL